MRERLDTKMVLRRARRDEEWTDVGVAVHVPSTFSNADVDSRHNVLSFTMPSAWRRIEGTTPSPRTLAGTRL